MIMLQYCIQSSKQLADAAALFELGWPCLEHGPT